MANRFYGSCSGSSGSKYYVYIDVTQNSQSIADNTSNITVSLKLKRNDGISESAYNSNESDNSVLLKVGGSDKVSKNLKIDTRGCVTVTLATWTGNVNHSSDGTLSVPISGSFTMSGTSLSGGSVSCSFKCSDIPRTSSFSLNKTSVNPSGTVTITVNAATSQFSHKAIWKCGTYSFTQNLSAGTASGVFTVPQAWANAVTKSKTAVISVSLQTYSGSKLIGTKSGSIKLIIPDSSEYKPTFSITLTRVNNSVPASWNTYVKGISEVTAAFSDVSCKYSAAVYSKSISFCSVTKSGSSCKFSIPKSGTLTITAKITDTRGFSTVKTATITVYDYKPPTLSFTSLYRCNSDGSKNTNGTYLAAGYTYSISSVNGKNTSAVKLKYKSSSDTSFSSQISVSSSPKVFGGSLSLTSSYTAVLSITDGMGNELSVAKSVSGASIPFNIKKGGKGAAFGCYAENNNELAIGYNLNVKGVIKYADITECLSCNSTVIGAFSKNVKYYKCLGTVFLETALTVSSSIAADTAVCVASISQNAPSSAKPLCAIATTSLMAHLNAHINSAGEIMVTSDKAVPTDTRIYISGFWFNNEEAGV